MSKIHIKDNLAKSVARPRLTPYSKTLWVRYMREEQPRIQRVWRVLGWRLTLEWKSTGLHLMAVHKSTRAPVQTGTKIDKWLMITTNAKNKTLSGSSAAST